MRKWIIGFCSLLVLGGVAWGVDNVPLVGFGGTRWVWKTTDTAGVHVPHVIADSGSTTAITVADGADVAQGTTTDGACAGDATSGCTLLQRVSRVAARLTSLITAVGSPFQAGGSIANTSFAATQATATSLNATVVGTGTFAVQANQVWAYPVGATPLTASATGTTGATTATLAAIGGKTTYICGYSIRANATAAVTVTNTITGVITATLSSVMWVAPLASGLGVDEQIFSPCIPASTTGQAIAIVSGAPGAGGTVSSKGWGYQL